MDFYGSTERIYISHDKGVTRIDFNGTNETVVGDVGQWTQTVPKPMCQFLGNLYVGHGTKLAEINSGATVSTYSKLSPTFPTDTQVRDIKLSIDGNYVQMVVSGAALGDITSISVDTSVLVPTDSFLFRWNGTDAGYTSSTAFPGIILTANSLFGDSEYTFGYDQLANAVYNPTRKFLTALPNVLSDSPLPNGLVSIGNLIQWGGVLNFAGNTYATLLAYGSLSDYDIERGFWCTVFEQATGDETDVVRMPFQSLVSNLAIAGLYTGYAGGIYGNSKIYYSTLETSSAPTTRYKLYKWTPFPTGAGEAAFGLFQTQNQLFSKKVIVQEVRIYGRPWVADNEFTVDLVGADDTPISGSSKTFTAGTNLTIGEDFAWYKPTCEPVYSLGLRITNLGSANFVISKVEIDYTEGGK